MEPSGRKRRYETVSSDRECIPAALPCAPTATPSIRAQLLPALDAASTTIAAIEAETSGEDRFQRA
jgi:hypothetical protein